MKDGFVKVAALSPDIRVADCGYNTEEICKKADYAAQKGCKIAVFPELSVSGYTCGDLFLQSALLQEVNDSLVRIAKFCKDKDILVIVGAPLMCGVKLYNCAVAIKDGRILAAVPKTYVPNYGEFYEARYFASAQTLDGEGKAYVAGDEVRVLSDVVFVCRQMPRLRVGAEVCEDLWVNASPSQKLCSAGATVVCNLSASDETIGKDDYRRLLVKSASGKGNCAYIYSDAGCGESTTDLVFAAHNIIAENGEIIAESQPFGDGEAISEVDVFKLSDERVRQNTFEGANCTEIFFDMNITETELTRRISPNPFVPEDKQSIESRCAQIFEIQARALAKRIRHTNCKSLVVGLSGGLDSALALLVMRRAADIVGMPATNITALTMPCFGTTKRTRSNAEKLAQGLGVSFARIDIAKSVERHLADIGHDGVTTDVTFENSQARERTQVLMDFANRSGGLVIGTGDLSELALGWATYNGDHMSMYGVNGSLPKTLIRHVVNYYADNMANAKTKHALKDILDTPVSPELLPAKDGEIAQKTEEIVGPYELHDFFIYYVIRYGFAPSKVYRLAKYALGDKFDDETIYKWLKNFYNRFFAQQFKRSCLPDGPKVGSVDFSPRGGWRMPSDACREVWLRDLEKIAH